MQLRWMTRLGAGIAAAVVAAVVLSGCNTARGIGQDIEKAGEAIQRAAD